MTASGKIPNTCISDDQKGRSMLFMFLENNPCDHATWAEAMAVYMYIQHVAQR